MIRLIAAGVALWAWRSRAPPSPRRRRAARDDRLRSTRPHRAGAAQRSRAAGARSRAREVLVTVVDGDTHRRRPRRPGRDRQAGGLRRRARPRAGEDQAACRAAGARLEAGLRDRGSCGCPSSSSAQVTIRLYRDALQWPMYGANARRTQAHTDIKLRPPFKVVWSRGVGALIEFPAVVSRRRRLRRQLQGHDLRADMRNGKRIWKYDPPGGKMASSPAIVGDDLVVHGMDGDRPRARPAQRPPALELPRRLADRVLADRPRRRSTTSAPGTVASTRST